MKISVMLFPYHGAMDQDLSTPEDLVKTFHDAGAVAIELMRGWNEKSPEKSILSKDPFVFFKTIPSATALKSVSIVK